MEIKTSNDIMEQILVSKYPCQEDGSRSGKYYKIINKKWVAVDDLIKFLDTDKLDLDDCLELLKELKSEVNIRWMTNMMRDLKKVLKIVLI